MMLIKKKLEGEVGKCWACWLECLVVHLCSLLACLVLVPGTSFRLQPLLAQRLGAQAHGLCQHVGDSDCLPRSWSRNHSWHLASDQGDRSSLFTWVSSKKRKPGNTTCDIKWASGCLLRALILCLMLNWRNKKSSGSDANPFLIVEVVIMVTI